MMSFPTRLGTHAKYLGQMMQAWTTRGISISSS